MKHPSGSFSRAWRRNSYHYIFCTLAALLLSASASFAQTAPQVIHLEPDQAMESLTAPSATLQNLTEAQETIEDGAICTTIGFEGIGNLAAVPEFDGITSPGWLAIIDQDAGGTGNIAFEPSPSTVAFWLGGAPGARDIEFTDFASKVGFFYTSFVTVTMQAFDMDGNLLDSASGGPNFNQGPGGDPNGSFNKWDLLEVESMESNIARVTVSGNVNQTAIDDLKVCRRLTIDRIEVTQAIQEIQSLDDLKADLAGDREPPVPLIEDKPAVMRVYPQQVQSTTRVQAELDIPNVTNQTRSLTLQPQCDPDLRRRREMGCRSFDFYFDPPGSNWTATVRLLTEDGEEIEMHELDFRSRSADDLVLRSVSVCDTVDAMGNWSCGAGANVGGLLGLLSDTAPTDEVRSVATNNFVRNDISTYDTDGNGTVDGNEAFQWFIDTADQVADLYGLWDRLRDLFGQENYYYGMMRTNLATTSGVGGIAAGIPSRGAMSRESTVRLGVEANQGTLAHEVGHALGRRHTNTGAPGATGGAPPGCYNTAGDAGTDWPFADNTLQSMNGPEVGYDVAGRDVKLPEENFEWMGYCVPRWISPFTYTNIMTPLNANFTTVAAAVEGEFWTVGGTIEGGSAALQPIYQLPLLGPDTAGTGAYRVETRDAGGAVLFTRFFDPRQAEPETTGPHFEGPLAFFELLPADPTAAAIAVVDPAGNDLGEVQLVGVAPQLSVGYPAAGTLLVGAEELSWTITDADSTQHWTAVDYSTDGGATWARLGEVTGSTLVVDFDLVSGSDRGLLRFTVSDGVNSSSQLVDPVSVGSKLPTVEILDPSEDEVFAQLDLVYLRANAYDADDGFLDGAAVSWFSSLDGTLGDGARLPLTDLSPGAHTLEVTATDSDGNTATDSVSIRIAAGLPSLDLTVVKLDQLPTTCVQVTLDATSASEVVGLTSVEYSLDGGDTWTAVALGDLPYRFIVPGDGFFHLVARTFDEAGQVDADDDRFFIDSPCELSGQPPVADAGDDQVVGCDSLDGAQVTLDGSGSFDPDGDDLFYTWTGDFPDGGGTVTGVMPTVTLPFGTSTLTLVVDDGVESSLPDTVEITVAAELEGLLSPLAGLVGEGEEPPLPKRSFNQGSTLPLKLRLSCGGDRLTDDDVAAPRIVSLTRDGVAVDLSTLDAESGNSNGGGLEFRTGGGQWIFNLSTADLEPGVYVLGIELPDGRTVYGSFEID